MDNFDLKKYLAENKLLNEDEVEDILSKPGAILFPGEDVNYISQLHDLEAYINSKGKTWKDYEPVLKDVGADTWDFSSFLDYASDEHMKEIISALSNYAKSL